MFLWIRKRVTYANVAMTFALVFAMAGGAYAAKKGWIITSTKQIKPSVIAQLRGKRGIRGAQGLQGPQGPAGPAGVAGKDGAPGGNGTAGLSVTVKKVEPSSAACNKLGGGEFTVGSSAAVFACNGANGADGTNGESVKIKTLASKEGGCEEGGSEFSTAAEKGTACNGSPWTAGGTLPPGKTETGTWDVEATAEKTGTIKAASISFPIPLTTKPAEGHIELVPAGGKPTSGPCADGTSVDPKAQPGFLCLYEVEVTGIHKGGLSIFNVFGPQKESEQPGLAGAMIGFVTTATGEVSSEGTWAVTD